MSLFSFCQQREEFCIFLLNMGHSFKGFHFTLLTVGLGTWFTFGIASFQLTSNIPFILPFHSVGDNFSLPFFPQSLSSAMSCVNSSYGNLLLYSPDDKEPSEEGTSEHDSSPLGTDGPVSYLHYPPSQRDSAFHHAVSSATSSHQVLLGVPLLFKTGY